MAALATANNGVLITSASGVPSILADGTTGQVLTATTGSPPSWVSPATSGTVTTVSVASANGFAGTVANATTTPAITLTTSQTGLLSGNGTAITGTAITQYNVLTAGTSNAPNSVAPGATSGVPLISQGSSSQPAFGTAVVAGGGTGVTTMTTAYAPVCSGTTATGALQVASTGLATSGYVLTSNGVAALPSFQFSSSQGTFTPTVFGATTAGTATYINQVGTYTRLGNTLFFNIFLNWSSGTGSGNLQFGGLPFTVNSGFIGSMAIGISTLAVTGATVISFYPVFSTTYGSLTYYNASMGSAGNVTYAATASVYVQGFYYI
jgi:hypothetical protein